MPLHATLSAVPAAQVEHVVQTPALRNWPTSQGVQSAAPGPLQCGQLASQAEQTVLLVPVHAALG